MYMYMYIILFIYLFIYLFILLDVVNGFGLLVHWSDDPQERLLTFKINGDSSIKTELINKISQMMCTSNCAPSPVSLGIIIKSKGLAIAQGVFGKFGIFNSHLPN